MTDADSDTSAGDLIDYLSPTWFEQANAALGDLRPISSPVSVAVRIVTGDPDRPEIHYRLILGSDRVGLVAGDERGDVRLTMAYHTARDIAEARLGAQRAFLDGDIKLGGDTTAILGFQQQLTDIEARLADLRSRTRY